MNTKDIWDRNKDVRGVRSHFADLSTYRAILHHDILLHASGQSDTAFTIKTQESISPDHNPGQQ